ncbi:MAG: type II secretion system F family protein [Raoultibacter sp.]
MKIALILFVSIGSGIAAYLALASRFASPSASCPQVAVPDNRKNDQKISRMAESINRFIPQAHADKDTLRHRLARAGLTCAPSVFYGVSIILAFTGIAAAVLLAPFASSRSLPLGFAFTAMLVALSVCLPRLYLNSATKKRRMKIEAQLPSVLELLTISVEAGLTMERAIYYVSTQGKGVLNEEFGFVDRDISLLGYGREQALRRLSDRCHVEGLSLFVAAVISSSKTGSPIAGVLKSQARAARTRRFQEVEEAANKIPTKMIFPLTFLIMPGVFIVVLAPAALSIAHNLIGVI